MENKCVNQHLIRGWVKGDMVMNSGLSQSNYEWRNLSFTVVTEKQVQKKTGEVILLSQYHRISYFLKPEEAYPAVAAGSYVEVVGEHIARKWEKVGDDGVSQSGIAHEIIPANVDGVKVLGMWNPTPAPAPTPPAAAPTPPAAPKKEPDAAAEMERKLLAESQKSTEPQEGAQAEGKDLL